MGKFTFDQFTYLHFASGIIAYFWGLPIYVWFILHTIFEVLENSKFGIKLINKIFFWPGGKPKADSFINSVGDTIGGMIGWGSAYLVDNIGNKYGWYPLHIK